MTDPWPRRPFTALPPPPAGAGAAVQDGRGIRRRRRVAGAGAAALSVAVVTAVIAASGAGSVHANDQLIPAVKPTSTSDRTATPARVDSAIPAAQQLGQASARAPGASTTTGGSQSRASSPSSGQGGSAPRGGGTTYRTPGLTRTYRAAPPPTPPSAQHGPSPRVCGATVSGTGENIGTSSDWCVRAVATATDRGHNLTIEICRDSAGPSQLTFARRNEVDLAVLAGDKTVWRWSVGHADAAAAHTLAAGADSCWSWTAPWTDVDASGRRLESGSYALSVTSTAREVSAVNPQQVTFRVS